MLTPVASYPEPGTLGERIELTREDILEVRLHGDGRMIVLNSKSTVLKNAKSLGLSSRDEEWVRQQIAMLVGQRYRGEGKPSELDRIGWKRTTVGYLDPHSALAFDKLRLTGLRAIDDCTNHTARNCACCAAIRETLWRVRGSFPDGTPEQWMCDRLLDELSSYDRLKPGGYGN